MEERLRKIGEIKASLFKKNFDKIYDFWKDKAMSDHNYCGELKFIKEHNRVFVYIVINFEDNLERVNPSDFIE